MFGTSAESKKSQPAAVDKSKSVTPEPAAAVASVKPPASKGASESSPAQMPPSLKVSPGSGQIVPTPAAEPQQEVTEATNPVNLVLAQIQQQTVVQVPPDKPVVQGNCILHKCLGDK